MKRIDLSRFTLHTFNYLPAAELRITIPTLFTLLRIALVPIVVGAMVAGWWGTAFCFFVVACATDVIDGLLARLLNEKTFLGACLDPVADKVLLMSCFITLAFVPTPLFALSRLFVFLVVTKELIQIGGACIIYYLRGHLNVQPTSLGKSTTCIQMIFIMWLFACYFLCWQSMHIYHAMITIMIFFISASFIQYVCIGLCMVTDKR